ncbi:hypothetical protein LJB92_00650 [Bacteroidales bacterium OttesenSCG-928-M06]|nr:hypothetical protein [Bacteroidales bacterium OttesenSCG-928-M06]
MKKYLFALSFLSFILIGCNEKGAQELLDQARSLYENAEYGSAKQMLDKLKEDYPKETKIRRDGLLLMREIEIKEQERNIAYCDSMISVRETEAVSLKSKFIFVKNEYDNIGKYVDKSYNPEPGYAPKYINAYISAKNDLVLMSVYLGTPINHSKVKASIPSGEFAETEDIPDDGGARYSFKDINGVAYETVTYQRGRDNGVLAFIRNYANKKITIEYLGGKMSVTYILSEKEKNAVANTVDYYTTLKDIEDFQKEKKKGEERLKYLEWKRKEAKASLIEE